MSIDTTTGRARSPGAPFFAAAACALALVIATLLAGCGRDEPSAAPSARTEQSAAAVEPAVPAETNAVKRRMADEEYKKALDKRLESRAEMMKKVTAARRALDAARKAGAAPEEVARLEGEMKAALAEMKRHEDESRALVGARIQQDLIEHGQHK